MKRTIIIGVAALLLGTATGSEATTELEEVSGALLKKICTSYVDRPSNVYDGMCIGYVVGVMSVVKYTNYFCLPSKSTQSQATLVVKKYLSGHPEKLHLDADGLVLEALIEAFPCAGQPMD
jgi:hypothetical protein